MNEKLRAKDLINAGLFTVLYFVLGCCVAIPIGFVPIFLPILGSLWTLITGIPFMFFAVRARKFGMVTLMAILSGLLMGFTGMGFWGVPLGVVFGLLGDRIMKSGQYQSWRKTLLGYGVFQLSGGEKQKIACAGAFLMEPPVFVLDEPSANLDADAVLELRGVLKTLKALGKTMILSEHRLYYLRGLADRYLYLRDGRIQGDYSGVEFDAIPAEERRAMGLRAGSLADLTLREEPDIRRGTAQLRDFRFAYKNAPEAQRIDGGHPLRRHRGHPGPQRGGEVHLLPLLPRPGEALRHRDGGRHRPPPQGPAGSLLHGDAGRGAPALHRERPGRGAPQHAGGGRGPGQSHPGPAGPDALSGPAPGVPLRRAEAAAGRRLRPGGGAERGLPG